MFICSPREDRVNVVMVPKIRVTNKIIRMQDLTAGSCKKENMVREPNPLPKKWKDIPASCTRIPSHVQGLLPAYQD